MEQVNNQTRATVTVANHRHDVLLGTTGNGFVATAVSSPYFYLEAGSQEAVMQKVEAALAFYHQHAIVPPPPHSLNRREG